MEHPEKALLVKATGVGDLKAQIIGYYHYDNTLNEHFVCNRESLIRYQVLPETIVFVNDKSEWIDVAIQKPEHNQTVVAWETILIYGKPPYLIGHPSLIDEWRDEYIKEYRITHWKSCESPSVK
jgi:hypothetical protein